MYTTLNKILECGPCGQEPCANGELTGWLKLLAHLGKTAPDDEPLGIETILESNGLNDALWALRAVEGYDREIRLLACDYAERVLPIYERANPGDMRPRECIAVARRYALGAATKQDLATALYAARAARDAARAARAAAWDAWDAARDARAAWDAARAARATARAAWDAARAAAWDAGDAARAAARAAAWAAAWDAERKWQEARLREMLANTEEAKHGTDAIKA